MMRAEEQKKLFAELKKKDSATIEDGIPNESEYTSARYRIMYVLKEVNGGSNWSLCKFLQQGGRPQTWDNIARWTEGIFKLPVEIPWEQLKSNCSQRRRIMLPKICAINLKKTSGKNTSNYKEIADAAKKNAPILVQQLELYSPDIIICCGTATPFITACFPNTTIEWNMTTRGIKYFTTDEVIVVDFSHPEARVKDCYLYYSLLDAMKEILKSK